MLDRQFPSRSPVPTSRRASVVRQVHCPPSYHLGERLDGSWCSGETRACSAARHPAAKQRPPSCTTLHANAQRSDTGPVTSEIDSQAGWWIGGRSWGWHRRSITIRRWTDERGARARIAPLRVSAFSPALAHARRGGAGPHQAAARVRALPSAGACSRRAAPTSPPAPSVTSPG